MLIQVAVVIVGGGGEIDLHSQRVALA